jgi:outer membrane protein OmpA-like peptidoglycan-associated protein
MSSIFSARATEQEENHWLSVSDLMAGLMVVFLFIAIALMRDAIISADKMREVAITYQQSQVDIFNALVDEFEDDLEQWDAEIDQDTLTFTFQSPDVLFETGQIALSERYQQLLADFFPRYLEVLGPYKDSISEVRIEGHTSSRWNRGTTDTQGYFLNMALSQGRTRSVLDYVYSLESVAPHRDWVKGHIAAVGLSSSKAIVVDGREDLLRSRRVSFRVISNADVRIKQIIEVDG